MLDVKKLKAALERRKSGLRLSEDSRALMSALPALLDIAEAAVQYEKWHSLWPSNAAVVAAQERLFKLLDQVEEGSDG